MTIRRTGRRAIILLAVAAIVAVAAALWAGRARERSGPVVTASGNRGGLAARMRLTATGGSLVVETHVENRREEPVHLVPDQCGRITEVVLVRTRFEPRGRTWTGSLQAVKRYVLADQRRDQHPDSFHPRRPGETSSDVPECRRPARPVTLAAGAAIDERWELPFTYAYSFDAVGSANSVVRAEVVEARDPDKPEFLDILAPGEADGIRRGRRLRLQEPASSAVERGPSGGHKTPSLGQLYDQLLDDKTLRQWLDAQPADSWRSADLSVLPDEIRFKAVTTLYERAVTATARPDATGIETRLPDDGDRARVWQRRPGTLPPGIPLIAEPDGWTLTDDVVADEVRLPSGRIVVGEYLLDAQPLDARVEPGSYPVRATLARHRRNTFDDVALASLVFSDQPTVRWNEAGAIAVDGGTATITSAEAAAALRDLFDRDEKRWDRLSGEMFDSLTAHDYQVTNFALGDELDLAMFSSGVGDGGYPVFVGVDAAGRPTRVVIDFLLLHLEWP